MSQSIDLSTITDATFNGSDVEQINLNGSGIWTKVTDNWPTVDGSWSLMYDTQAEGYSSYENAARSITMHEAAAVYPMAGGEDFHTATVNEPQQYPPIFLGTQGASQGWHADTFALKVTYNPSSSGYTQIRTFALFGRSTPINHVNQNAPMGTGIIHNEYLMASSEGVTTEINHICGTDSNYGWTWGTVHHTKAVEHQSALATLIQMQDHHVRFYRRYKDGMAGC